MKRILLSLLFIMGTFFLFCDPGVRTLKNDWRIDSLPDNYGLNVTGEGFFTHVLEPSVIPQLRIQKSDRVIIITIQTADQDNTDFHFGIRKDDGSYYSSPYVYFCEFEIHSDRIELFYITSGGSGETGDISVSGTGWDSIIKIDFSDSRPRGLWNWAAEPGNFRVYFADLNRVITGDVTPEVEYEGENILSDPGYENTYFFNSREPFTVQIKEAEGFNSPFICPSYEVMENNLWNPGWEVSDDAEITQISDAPVVYRYEVTPSHAYPTSYSLKLFDIYGNSRWYPPDCLTFYPDSYAPVQEGEIVGWFSFTPGDDFYSQYFRICFSDQRELYNFDTGEFMTSYESGPELPILTLPEGAEDVISLRAGVLNGNYVTYEFLVQRGVPLEGIEIEPVDKMGNRGVSISLDDEFHDLVPRCQFDDASTLFSAPAGEAVVADRPYILNYGILVGKSFSDPELGVRRIHLENSINETTSTIYSYNPDSTSILGLALLPDNPKFNLLTGAISVNIDSPFIGDFDTSEEKEFSLMVNLMYHGLNESGAGPIRLKIPDIPIGPPDNDVVLSLYDGENILVSESFEHPDWEQTFFVNHPLELKIESTPAGREQGVFRELNRDPLKLKQYHGDDNFSTSLESLTINKSLGSGDLVLLECRADHNIDNLPDVEYALGLKVIYDEAIRLPDDDLFSLYDGDRDLIGSDNTAMNPPEWIRIHKSVFEDWENSESENLGAVELFLDHPRRTLIASLSFPDFINLLEPHPEPSLGLGYSMTLEDYQDLAEGEYEIRMKVTDRAGNTSECGKTFVIDRTAVALPIELVQDNLVRVEESTIPLTGYDFDWVTGILSFSISTHPCYWQESVDLCHFGLQGLENYSFITRDSLSVYYNDQGHRINSSFHLESDYPPNGLMTPVLSILDPAGNQSLQSLRIYTPACYPDLQEAGLFPVIAETGVDGAFLFSWWDQGFINPGRLILYRIGESGETTPLEKIGDRFLDADINAHGVYNYRLSFVNGSEYESAFGGSLDFYREVRNNNPVITNTELYSFSIEKDETNWVGPDCSFEINIEDVDGDSLHTDLYAKSLETGETFQLGAFSQGDEECFSWSFSLLPPELQNGDIFFLRLDYQDSWTVENGDGTTVEVCGDRHCMETGTLRFDGRGPEISLSQDMRAGYPSGYDGFSLTAVDCESGFDKNVLQITRLDSGGEPGETVTSYVSEGTFHYSFPEEGEYRVQIQSMDLMGNVSILDFPSLSIDFTRPEIFECLFSAAEEDILYLRSPKLPWQVTCRDNFSGINELAFQLCRMTGGVEEVLVEKVYTFFDGLARKEEVYQFEDIISLPEAGLDRDEPFWAVWQVSDNSGNVSDEFSSLPKCVVYDATPPEVEINYSGLYSSGGVINVDGRFYLTKTEGLLKLKGEVEDPHPGENYGWILLDGAGEKILSGSDEYYTLEQAVAGIGADGDYSLIFAGEDLAGNRSEPEAFSFTLDTAPPEISSESLMAPDAPFHPGEVLRIPLPGVDENLITAFFIKIGNLSAGDNFFSSRVVGNENGILTVFYPDELCRIRIPDIPAGEYSVLAAAEDLCGNRSSFTQIGQFETIVEEDYLTVIDGAQVQRGSADFRGFIEYYGSREVSSYYYRLIGPADGSGGYGPPLNEWCETDSNTITLSFEAELPEGVYRFEAGCECLDGTILPPAISNGITVDNTPPVFEFFNYSSFISQPAVDLKWELNEKNGLETINLEYSRYLRDSEGQLIKETTGDTEESLTGRFKKECIGEIEFNPVASNPGSRIEIADSSGIENGDIFECVLSVSDRAGNHGNNKILTVIFDDTPPEVIGVSDPGDYINPLLNDLVFRLIGFPSDEESGISEIQWQLLRGKEEPEESDWVSYQMESRTEALFISPAGSDSLAEMVPVFLAVRIENGAGMESVVYSDGIIPDRTKPKLAEVELNGGLIAVQGDRISCVPSGSDVGGRIEKIYWRCGTYKSGVWSWSEEEIRNIEGLESFDILLPSGTEESSLLQFEFTLQDAAGHFSLPCLSPCLYTRPSASVISDFVSHADHDSLSISWAAQGAIPFREHLIELTRGVEVLQSQRISGSSVSWESPLPEEGMYEISIRSTNAASITSLFHEEFKVDRTPPVVEIRELSSFVSDTITFLLFFADESDRIEKWHYRLGRPGSPGIFTAGWIEENGVSGIFRDSLLFSELENNSLIRDGDLLSFEIEACDSAGNWSEIVSSDWSLVDQTPPQEISIAILPQFIPAGNEIHRLDNNYLTDQTTVRGIELIAVDEESGIGSYDYFITSEGGIPRCEVRTITLEEPARTLHLEGVKAEGNTFIDGEECRVHFAFRNRAGELSEWVSSTPVRADFSLPELEVYWEAVATEVVGEEERFVLNGDSSVLLKADDRWSEAVAAETELYSPANELLSRSSFLWFDYNRREELFLDLPEDEWGIYSLEIRARDSGGNLWAEPRRIPIRYNAPPELNIPGKMKTFPGAELDLNALAWGYHDPDGPGRIIYTLKRPDFFLTLTPSESCFSVQTSLLHSIETATVTSYELECLIEDSLGQGAVYTGCVEVVNKEQGTMNVDETWSGLHQLFGPVVVPEGVSLIIADGTRIESLGCGGVEAVFSEVDSTERGGLNILPGGEILHQGSATYDVIDGSGFWSGLRLGGKGNLSSLSIRRALRGLVLEETASVAEISGCEFLYNTIGLHLFRDGVEIEECSFINNLYYGIKEDQPVEPEMHGNVFQKNGWDYYDSNFTVRKIDE